MLEWLPAIPNYQAFCRRLSRLEPAFRALAEIWAEQAAAKEEDTCQYVVDSCPIMACQTFYRRKGRERVL